jgi:hypothetical protein
VLAVHVRFVVDLITQLLFLWQQYPINNRDSALIAGLPTATVGARQLHALVCIGSASAWMALTGHVPGAAGTL